MIFRSAIMLVAVGLLGTAASLKAASFYRSAVPWNPSDALLVVGEGTLAVCAGLFLCGRKTGWVVSAVFLIFANVALYKAFAGKPCGCLGTTVVNPWLMSAVDFALSLSLLVVAGWTPWKGGRPRWATASTAVGSAAVAAAVLVAVAVSRQAGGNTPPKVVADITDSIRRNYDGVETERYDLAMVMTQPVEPYHSKTAEMELTILPRMTSTSVISRRDGLITQTYPGGERYSTDGRLQIQYIPKSNDAWVRYGDGLSRQSLDLRKYGLPRDWNPAAGVAGSGTEWRHIEPTDRGPQYAEVTYTFNDFNRERTVNLVFDKSQNLLPVSVTYSAPGGKLESRIELTYTAVLGTNRFRLDSYTETMPLARPTPNDEPAVITYKVNNYGTGGTERPGEVDFLVPTGTRIVDTVSLRQRKSATVKELFAVAKSPPEKASASAATAQVGWRAWAALGVMDIVYLLAARRRLRFVSSVVAS